MKEYVIIVAGGIGTRMGVEIPKQFLAINGKAIIIHTLDKFNQALPSAELVLVLPENEVDRWNALSKDTEFVNVKVMIGGSSRFQSVKSGLSMVPNNCLVAVHDAVRPFVSSETIKRVFHAAKQKNAAIPVIDLKDSLRELSGENSIAVDRSKFRLVQTPQCFKSTLLKRAYEQADQPSFTDDASVVESLNEEVSLVEGNYENIKITTIDDLRIAEVFLSDNL